MEINSDISQRLDIRCRYADTFRWAIKVLNPDGTPFTFEGVTVQLKVKNTLRTSLMDFTGEDGITLEPGLILMEKTPDQMRLKGSNLVYKIKAIYDNGDQVTLFHGQFIINDAVGGRSTFDNKDSQTPPGSSIAGITVILGNNTGEVNGSNTIHLTIQQTGARGPIGPDGERGEKGDSGPPGNPGSAGEKGQNGNDGQKGDKGDQGEKGETGERGEKGNRGDKGDIGPDGVRGEKGEQGERGETGSKGEKGEKGERGEKGEVGAKGDQGEKGATGDQGQTGQKGDQGTKGDTGQKGDKGDQGTKGDKGDKGDTGAQGDTRIKYAKILQSDANGNLTATFPAGTFAAGIVPVVVLTPQGPSTRPAFINLVAMPTATGFTAKVWKGNIASPGNNKNNYDPFVIAPGENIHVVAMLPS